MKITHITAHLGAGVGKAISGMIIADKTNEYKILVLDKPEKFDSIYRLESNGVKVDVTPDDFAIREAVEQSDIVIVNWWHHPLIYKVLIMISNTPTRLVLWSHVNGLKYPSLKIKFLKVFDGILFTSAASFENVNWSLNDRRTIEENASLIYGIGDFTPDSFSHKEEYQFHNKIKIGYAGSLDYAKINPDFVEWIEEAIVGNINLEIEIAGDITEDLLRDIKQSKVAERIKLLGFRSDIQELLTRWDIFVYPLNPYNFATTENALLEAMAAALPIVVSDGIIEKSIIKNSCNGLVVSNKKTFSEAINRLTNDCELRAELGRKAREDVINCYNATVNCERYQKVLENLLLIGKKHHDFRTVLGDNAFEWFLSGCGEYEEGRFKVLVEIEEKETADDEKMKMIENIQTIYKGKSKGSVGQYHKYYPEDKKLMYLDNIINKLQEKLNESENRDKIS